MVAVEPIEKRYLSRLESLQKELTRKGDLNGALAAKAAIDSAKSKLSPGQPGSIILGTWAIKYANGVTRTYVISRDNSVFYQEEKISGRIVRQGNEWLINFGNPKFERLVFKNVLEVEVYGSQAAVAGRRPDVVGTGTNRD